MAFRTNKVPAIEERTVSGSSVSFNSAFALPLKACKVSFSATESGTGEKSPSNPYTISGVSSLNLSANSVSVSVNFGNTKYGGYADLIRKKLVVTRRLFQPTTSDNIVGEIRNTHNCWCFTITTPPPIYKANGDAISNINIVSRYADTSNSGFCTIGNTKPIFALSDSDTGLSASSSRSEVYEAFKTFITTYNPICVYELTTPIEIDLSSIPNLSSIIGNNTFSTDTGTLEITFSDLQEKSASGAVATFNTALAMPLVECNIAVNAWQEGSGDPYPAGGSAQIWDEEWELGKYTDGVKEDATNRLRSKNPIAVTPNTTYYFYCNTSVYNDWIVVFWYDENHTYLRNEAITQNRTFTSPNDAYYMNFNTSQAWGSRNYANNFSFNYPATDTSYHPYSNVRPIHGFSEVNATRAGRNFYNENWESGAFNGNTGLPTPNDNFSRSVDFIDVIPNTPYYLYVEGINSTNNILAFQYDRNGNFLSGYQSKAANGVITFPDNCYKIKFAYRRPYDTISDYSVALNYPSTATAYDPYVTPTIYTIQLGQEVYGAEVDVVNGVAHCTHGKEQIKGTDSFSLSNTYQGSIYINNAYYPEIKSKSSLICNKLKYVGNSTSQFVYGSCISLSTSTNYWIKNGAFVDRQEAIDLLNELQLEIVYELAEPFDIQLTPQQIETLIGNNTIFADTGDVDLTYKDLDIAKRGNFREVFKLPS